MATMTRKHFNRFADGFAYVAGDPTADRSTVEKLVHEFCIAAKTFNPAFNPDRFRRAVFSKRGTAKAPNARTGTSQGCKPSRMAASRIASLLTTLILAFAVTSCAGEDSAEPNAAPSSGASATPSRDDTEPTASQTAPSGPAAPDAADAEATLRTFLKAYGSGHAAEACALSLPAYTRATIKSAVDQGGDKAGASCEEVYEWGHGVSVAFGANFEPVGLKVTVDGEKATAPATYKGSGAFTYYLTFENGHWLVSGDSDLGYFG